MSQPQTPVPDEMGKKLAEATEPIQPIQDDGHQKKEPMQVTASTEPRTSQCPAPAHFHIPQFSKSTQEILDRMRSNLRRSPSQAASQSAAQSTSTLPARFGVTYEDVKRRLVEQLKTSDHVDPTPTPKPATLADTSAMPKTLLMPSNSSTASFPTLSLKRKRAEDVLPSSTTSLDLSQSTLHMPPLSPLPKQEEGTERDSPAPILHSTWGRADVERMREERLALLPEFNKPRLVGFVGGNAPFSQRKAYFSKLKDSDLVNLLLFSDAIKDGLLIDVLASVSRKHPDLPLFPHPDWDTMGPDEWAALSRSGHSVTGTAMATSAPPANANAANTATTTAEAAPKRPPNKKPKISAIRKVQESEVVGREVEVEVEEEEQEEEEKLIEEPLPQAWPKPGHGLYATLPPERDDPTLRDDNDEEAFSGFFVDRMGRQVVEPVSG
ncbi:hypothetical protein SODALDRAFT_331052 [Sodiomyces alkalinus F11]|uniref:Uncharacterized protein n=1 Tax=Sodiomyces alkalinus (strain CBS 110278 / VKM F-3762 / F11) TaxID=1314773 RepID=A0A3N2Q3I2_SODAK|nr:hypothetical protein SODALDRAFT_331052 [Sodiomyces alkalinus F11]ROT41324.1 hypothetical protein SODALDRAFT_331052 [Sodiomyces alkalinus F11]